MARHLAARIVITTLVHAVYVGAIAAEMLVGIVCAHLGLGAPVSLGCALAAAVVVAVALQVVPSRRPLLWRLADLADRVAVWAGWELVDAPDDSCS